jgi:hypothetical protein
MTTAKESRLQRLEQRAQLKTGPVAVAVRVVDGEEVYWLNGPPPQDTAVRVIDVVIV